MAVILASVNNLRRVPCDPAHACHVQEKRALGGKPIVSKYYRAALPRFRRALHPGAARPLPSGNQPPRQSIRHGRHGNCRADNAGRSSTGRCWLAVSDCRPSDRWWYRCNHRQAHCHDGHAAACGGIPFASGHGSRSGGRRCALRSGSIWYRYTRRSARCKSC